MILTTGSVVYVIVYWIRQAIGLLYQLPAPNDNSRTGYELYFSYLSEKSIMTMKAHII